jgi:hypothetical protein
MTPRRNAGESPAVDLADLSPEVRKQLEKRTGKKLRAPRRSAFSKDEVRRYAIRALAVLADLRPSDRRRVLFHAAKLNEV